MQVVLYPLLVIGTVACGGAPYAPFNGSGTLLWPRPASFRLLPPASGGDRSVGIMPELFKFQAVNASGPPGATIAAPPALQAAFDRDAGGHHTTLVCVRGCELDQVWLGFEAVPFPWSAYGQSAMRPLVMPSHGVNTMGPSSCASCWSVHIVAWHGCP